MDKSSLTDNIVTNHLERAVDFILDYKKQFLAGIVATGILVAGALTYSWHRTNVAMKAHKALVAGLKMYEAPVAKEGSKDAAAFSTEQEKWQAVAKNFEQAAQDYASTNLAPMFNVYQAQALLKLEQKAQALELMEQAVKNLSNKELQDFFAVKVALLSLDSDVADKQQKGLEDLREAAEDPHHAAHEYALYHLGLYYWNNKNFVQVKNYWQQLLVKYSARDPKKGGAYTAEVKAKLALITNEN